MIGKCRLSAILKQRNMTQSELSRRTGVSTPQLNRYIKDIHIMPLPIAFSIAYTLNCNVEDLYELDLQQQPGGNQTDEV